MASFLPFSLGSQIPVTPPPDHQFFMRGPLSPELLKSFTQDVHGLAPRVLDPLSRESSGAPTTSTTPKTSDPGTPVHTVQQLQGDPQQQQQQQQQQQRQRQQQQQQQALGANLDPRTLAMASRIATYYQQRCQAVATYQQHRCQAWLNAHRQKCQEMMQAATLVVAWYVRDRIQKRRKRRRFRFRKALSERASQSKVAKSERVRRWTMAIPKEAPPSGAAAREKFADQEEAHFSMDRESTPDSDTKLFDVADGLIKNQLSRIDVPMLGALSFDESDSESDSDSEEDDRRRSHGNGGGTRDGGKREEPDGEEGVGDEDYEDYDELDDEGYDLEEDDECAGSEEVQMGTATRKGSREHNPSSIS